MAEELNNMLTDGAQADEDVNRLSGNMQDAPVVDPSGSVDNPGGSSPTGGATDNTGIEQAPESQPPAANVTQDIPPPTVDETGSSGGIGGTSTTNEAPQQPTVPQTAVAQDDPTLGTPDALAPGEEPNNPPSVAVLPGTPDVPPDAGTIGDPSDDDDVYNDQLRADPSLTLPPGAVAELGLENGYGTLATTRGTIVIGDPDGINDIATVTIAGRTYSLVELYAIDPEDPRFQIELEAGDGDDISEGTLVLERFDPVTGEIFFRFDLKTPVDNDGTDNPNINENSALIPIQVTVTDQAGSTATADGGIRIVDATPDVVTSALAGAPDPFVSDDDALGTPISSNFADNFSASFNPGSDGESSRSTTYDLSIGGDGRTGLFDLQGREIVLVEENGVITGVAGGVPMFTVSVDAAGNVTLTQLQPLQHLNAQGQPNDSLSLPAGLINLTRTDTLSDTDGDTDVSSATIEISSGFTFLDSVPSLSVQATDPIQGNLQTPDSSGTDAQDYSGAFGWTPTPGADGAAMGAVSYALSIAAPPVNGLVDSGLETPTGQAIYLWDLGGTIVGSTATSQPANTSGSVFTLAVDANGVVTLVQNLAIEHTGELESGSAPGFDGTFADDIQTLADGLVELKATRTITDNDGDSFTTSAEIDLGGNVSFTDVGPSLAVTTTDPASGNLQTPDSGGNDTQDYSGAFSWTPTTGADGAAMGVVSYGLSIAAPPVNGLVDSGLETPTGQTIYLWNVGGTIVGSTATSQPANTSGSVFTLAVDANGVVTLVQNLAIEHTGELESGSAPGFDGTFADDIQTLADGLVELKATRTITDNDGDRFTTSAEIDLGGNVSFTDVGPSLAVTTTDPTSGNLQTPDSGGNDTQDYSGAFSWTPTTGADGASMGAVSYGLSIAAPPVNGLVDSGLETPTGQTIYLWDVGGTIVGSTATSQPANTSGSVFTLAVDANGVVTLVQNLAIEHTGELESGSAPGFDGTFADDIQTLADGLVELKATRTITDNDGDRFTTSAEIDLGGNVSFTDVGPSLTVNAVEGASAQLLTALDETQGNTDRYATGESTDVFVNQDLSSVVATSLTSIVGGIEQLFAIGGDPGADGLKSQTGTLSFAGIPEGGSIATQLVATDGGAVRLVLQDGVVVGLDTDGDTVLTIELVVLNGVTQLRTTQVEALSQPNGEAANLYDNSVALLLTGEDALQILYTVVRTDGDLDAIERQATIELADANSSVFSFDDDGITALDDAFEVKEGGKVSGNVLFNDGANASGTDGYAENPIANAGTYEATDSDGNPVGVLKLNPDGTFEFTAYSNVIKADTVVNFDVVTKDADGDTVTTKLTITLLDQSFVVTDDDAIVDESFLPGGNQDPDGGSSSFTGFISGDSANGPLSFALEGGETTLEGLYGTLVLDPKTGEYTYQLNDNYLAEGAARQIDEAVESFTYVVTDVLGNTSTGVIEVAIQDDVPDAVVSNATADTLVLDETRALGTDTAGGSAPTGLATITANFADNFNSVAGFDYGSDVPGSVAYALNLSANGIASGLFALETTDTSAGDGDGYGQGASIVLNKVGSDILGQVGGTTYFTISVDSAGVVTFSQALNIWHGTPGTSYDEPATLTTALASNLQITQTLTDADGDTDSASINLGASVFSIQDDGPDAVVSNATADTLVLDETRALGTDTAGGSAPTGLATITANFADNFNSVAGFDYGSDVPGSVAYALNLSANGIASGLFALETTDTSAGDGDGYGQGASIVLNKVGSDILGQVGGTTYFTISVDSAGVVTFSQALNIWHGTPGTSYDEPATLTTALASNLQITQTLTDADGDTDSASINLGASVFSIQDDGPDAVVSNATADTLVLDETRALGTDTAGGSAPTGLATITANFADNFNSVAGFDYGSDVPGSVAYALNLSANGIASGLFALETTDTSAGDGDGYGQGASIVLNKVGSDILGQVGGTTYFTISVDSAGVVTFSQALNIWHGTPGTSYDEPATLTTALASNLQITQTLTDADGDTDSASINLGASVFSIQDDGPDAVVSNATADTLVLDETRALGTDTAGGSAPTGLATITANFADNFNSVAGFDYGSDVPGSVAYALNLSANGIASGLFALETTDTSAGDGDGYGQGASIVLNKVGSDILGQVGGTTYFTISVDSAGVVTFSQALNIWHGTPGTSYDEPATLTTALASNLQITQTLTDADGDTDSASINLGASVFSIQDDGPDAVVSNATADTLVLDETRALGTDTAGGSAPTGLATITANFADNFNSVAGFDYGSDVPGSVAYALNLSANGIASGLFALETTDTSAGDGDGYGQGASIVLNKVGSDILGQVGGTTYFTISVDSAGVVTFSQALNIWHGTPGTSYDEPATLTTALASNLQITQTLTDADGDTDSASINLGASVFSIQDDGPDAVVSNATADTLVLDETRALGTDTAGGSAPTGLATITANFADNFNSVAGFDYGSDVPGSVAYALNLSANGIASGLFALETTDTSAGDGDGYGQGASIVLNKVGSDILGQVGGTTYFTISVDSAGVVTFSQALNIWHGTPGTSYDEPATLTTALASNLQITQTLTDADGDTDSASINLGASVFSIQDDGPDAVVSNATADTLVLDETRALGTDTAGGSAPTGLATITANFADNFNSVAGFDYGSDVPGSVAYALNLSANGIASGLFALETTDTSAGDGDGYGQGASIVLNKVGSDILGQVGGTTYFTISVDSAGVVTFSQALNIWHGTPGTSYDEPATLTTALASNLQITQTLTDADGDTDSASINLGASVFSIQDDGPDAVVSNATADTLVLDETRALGTDTAGGSAPTGLATITANFADNFNSVAGFDYGSDVPGSVAYALNLSANGIASGLFALETTDTSAGDGDGYGQGASIVLNKVGSDILGQVGGTTYFTISVDSAGVVTFSQALNIWHGTPGTSYDEPATLTTALASNLQITQTLTDADGDTDSASINLGASVFSIQDDGPDAVVSNATADTLVLDETRALGTDTAGGSAPTGLATITANFADNFNSVAGFDYGSDVPGSVAYALNLSANGIASGLFALETTDTSAGDGDGYGQGASIVLNKVGSDILGQVGGTTYFTISVDSAGVVTFSQALNIWHGTPGTSYDEPATLTTALASNLQITQTLTDADGDTDSASINLGASVFSIQDDGPDAVVSNATADTLVLDETRALGTDTAGGSAPTGLATITANFADNFNSVAGFDYGSDVPGSVAYALNLSANGIASGLFALETTDTSAGDGDGYGQGASIVLNKVGSDILGQVGGTTYFTISVDSAGVVTFSQALNIWHGTPGTSYDEPATLTTALASNLQITQTLTDADGDTDSASINLGASVFSIQDDGPDAVVSNATADTLVLDETRALGTDTAGGSAPTGLATITANFADNFNSVAGFDYGSDVPGSVAYALNLSANGIASGLFALETTDTSAGDGDGYGQGASIVLNKVGNDILGQVGTTTYFTISVNSAGVVTFSQSLNIWHPTPGTSYDEPATLTTLLASNLQLTQTLTDADGDTDSASINLGAGVFSIQDDGPAVAFSDARDTAAVAATGISGVWTGGQGTDSSGVFFDAVSTNTDFLRSVVVDSIYVNGALASSSTLSAGEIVYAEDGVTVAGAKYTGTYAYDNPADSQSAVDVGYTLLVNVDGTYLFSTTIPAGTKTFDTINDALTLQPGGPINSKVYTVVDSVTGDSLDVRFSTSTGSGVNVSGQGVGVNNNILEYDKGVNEVVTIDPLGSDVVKAVNLLFTGTGQQLFSASQGDSLLIQVWAGGSDPNGPPAKTITLSGVDLKSYSVDADVLQIGSIDKVTVTTNSTTTNLKMAVGVVVEATEPVNPVPVSFNFTATVADVDGDTATSSFNVLVSKPATPVSLDLDRSGSIDYVSLESPFDLGFGSGLEIAGWVSSSDGLLTYDYNGDGQITEAKEFVFTMWGDYPDVATDMQALAAYFDSNKDGVFDSQDDAWDSFGVWQDLNVDGIQQTGEYASLGDWGIESIALSYDDDSTAYTAAGGDVQVFGQMTVSYADGTTGLAEDMAFAVQSAVTTAEAPLASTSEPAYPVDELVTSYLESMAVAGDTDSNGELSAAELAYGLDDMVSQFIDAHGFSIDDHAAIQQEVYNELAHELNDLSVDDGIDIAFDATGDANGAEVLAALDDHFMDIYDAHITPAESYDDSGSMMV